MRITGPRRPTIREGQEMACSRPAYAARWRHRADTAPSHANAPHVLYSRDGSTWCLKALNHGKREMPVVWPDMAGDRWYASEEVIVKGDTSTVAVTFFAALGRLLG